MSSFEKMIFKQRSLISSKRNTIANFKKLGHSKMNYAAAKMRIETTKERFEQCRTLDAKLRVIADAKTVEAHLYFAGLEFVTCEDAYDRALDYLYERLDEGFPFPDTVPVNQLHHFFSCLKGEASAAIEHLALTSENFAVAWQIFSSRYENRRQLIGTHLNKLFSLPAVNAKSAQELRALRDRVNATIAALKNLARPVEQWSNILVFLITQKLDTLSREAWEIKLVHSVDYPTYTDLDAFLESRVRAFDSILPFAADKANDPAAKTKAKSKAIASHTVSASKLSCPVCSEQHLLYQCNEFVNKTPVQRYELVRKFKRCLNCFSSKHQAKECTSSRSCKTCQKRHHTLLHFPDSSKQSDENASSSSPQVEPASADVASHLVAGTIAPPLQIFLATAQIRVYSGHGRFQTVRALLDQGSAASFMTENLAQTLRVQKARASVNVTGIGDTRLHLANRDPASSAPVDIIIGADLFGSLLLEGVRKGTADEPITQHTVLGWIISGPTGQARRDHPIEAHHVSVDDDLDLNLRRFWEVEEIPHQVNPRGTSL
ncbi:uncharacterized protein [Temnothorax longispinosus]|uniref:uncharacterized protein n=1 Tax=Temnothorax longispinosus TaxID=300112 RepID=UPI003A992AAE